MKWVDVCGAPGSGKSTLCDPLWHPHSIEWDGYGIPKEWDKLLEVCDRLLRGLEDHETYRLLFGMTRRSLRKMASVYRSHDHRVYVQTGLAQRGLGFGWRLEQRGQVEKVREYFRVMPVSLGVAVIHCPVNIAQERNRQRELVKQTSHENRQHMVPLMVRPTEILIEEMERRGVPLISIDTTGSIDRARQQLVDFASTRAFEAAPAGPDRQVAAVL